MKAVPPAFFVAGTDTEIGKTLVSCALIHTMVKQGWQSVGMKPVAAGAELVGGQWQNEDVTALTQASNVQVQAGLINPYLFRLAAAPHIAAQQERSHIDLALILQRYRQLAGRGYAIVVEGVGGFRVPLNDSEDSADMAQQLALPVVLVVGMRLGCISAALLSAEAIAARGLKLAGWVANSAQNEMTYLQDNLSALRQRLDAPCLGCIPHMEQPDPARAAGYLELTTLIKKYQ